MIRLAAFDMAGTTIDEHGIVYDALAAAVIDVGHVVAERDLQLWMGAEKRTAIDALIRLNGGNPSQDTVDRAFRGFERTLAERYDDTPPFALPGVPDLFVWLHGRGIRVALTTGFSSGVSHSILARLGWGPDLIDCVISSDEVAEGRPAPYLIHHAMEKTGVDDVADVLVAGDTVRDLEAGARAGVAVNVGVLSGKLDRAALEAVPHSYVLDSVVDIMTLDELGDGS